VIGLARRQDFDERVAIARHEVAGVQLREDSPGRTVALLLGILVGSLILLFVAFCLAVCNDPNY